METRTNTELTDFSAVRSKAEHCSAGVLAGTTSSEAQAFGRNVQNVEVRNINKEINVTAWYFRNRHQRLMGYPRRIEFDRQEYTFAEGLRFLIHKGKQAVQLFDMTDGDNKFRLRFDDQQQTWTLVSITHATRAI
jgi:hypothetical protein